MNQCPSEYLAHRGGDGARVAAGVCVVVVVVVVVVGGGGAPPPHTPPPPPPGRPPPPPPPLGHMARWDTPRAHHDGRAHAVTGTRGCGQATHSVRAQSLSV